ncbi:MAG: hypothetical protein WCA45_12430 [Thiobacillaceae bacterium]
MHAPRLIPVMFAGFLFAGPVLAEDKSPEPGIEQFGAMVKPADVDLFFNYLRDAMKAGMAGKTPPAPPPELQQRAQELARTFKEQGAATMDQMLQQFQEELKESLPPEPRSEPTPEPAPELAPDAPDKSSQPDSRT